MSWKLLEKLEWPELVERIAGGAQTHDGRSRCQELLPNLSREGVEERWALVKPLADLVHGGYRAPIGELEPMRAVMKAN